MWNKEKTLLTRLNNAKIQNQILKERNNEMQISYQKNSEELEEVWNVLLFLYYLLLEIFWWEWKI